jgi:serine/threonine protein kinase
VKPGNILFAEAHTAKIVDFGLAVFMEDEESVRGEIWGTPYYVAPRSSTKSLRISGATSTRSERPSSMRSPGAAV